MWRKLFNRRKGERFYVQEKTFIVFKANTKDEKLVRIIDISEGGCGFIYQGDEKELEKICNVDLSSDNNPHLNQINITTANDRPAVPPYRRRGVEFSWLGFVNEEKLRDFIKKVSTFKAE
jgi:hypothetical protein